MTMSETPNEGSEQIEEVSAVDFAEEAKRITKFRNDWGTTKDSMTSWLKQKVGSKIQGTFEKLDDEIIKSARQTSHKALDYLKDCKRHVLRLAENPDMELSIHNNPPRDIDSLPDTTIAETINWWVSPISEESTESSENSNSQPSSGD